MNFPKIHKITINNFSLYKQKDEIELDLKDGVFCLAGANGLGKSTFIAIVSYALMGIVIDPKKNFDSINQITEFYKKNEKFAETYFDGRIDESKRDLAYVGIEFTVGEYLYKLKRNFFETTSLLKFSRINKVSKEETIDENVTSTMLLDLYKKYLTQDIGVTTFEQFAFIQSFVLTFDESKKLIFWDTPVMNRILHLFFGIDPDYANRADDLRKKVSKHESNMRNIKWNITQNEREIVELTNPSQLDISIPDAEALMQKIKTLENTIETEHKNIESNLSTVKECDLNISDLAIKLVDLKAQYERNFQLLENSEISIERDSTIISLLRKISKEIINNNDVESDFEYLKKRIIEVSQTLNEQFQEEKTIELQNIDDEITKSTKIQEEYIHKKSRIKNEIDENKRILDNATIELNNLRKNNEQIIKQYDLYKVSNINDRVNSIRKVIENDNIRKIEETKLRDKYKEELKIIEKQMREQYNKTEVNFIPIFKKYATNFLGLDIDVELKNTSSIGLYLSLKVNNTERKDKYQLSESQQYFIDIALRFALIEISASKYATIFIDTPEGSLDIAYESRAGKMFGDFVKQGFDIIMTANINSSQLLLQLANKCLQEKMQIERMTEWTILSAVQQEEQNVIEDAFNDIERALNGAN